MSKYPDIFEVPTKFDYAKKISWYALPPKLYASLEKLKKASSETRWKFKTLTYPMIADHIFWKINVEFYPLSNGIEIINPTDSFPGTKNIWKKE